MKTYLKFAFLAALVGSFIGLTGCENTVSGFGKDMQQNGQKIEHSANS